MRYLLLLCILALPLRLPAQAPAALTLARQLYDEGQWELAQCEAERASTGLASNTLHYSQARLLAALATLRLDTAHDTARESLQELWHNTTLAMPLRTEAALQLAFATWQERVATTREAVTFVYFNATEVEEYWVAAAALYKLLRSSRKWRRSEPLLWQTVRTARQGWPWEIELELQQRLAEPSHRLSRLPADLIVGGYRSFVAPAIGSRCELEPSCSAYFVEAAAKHGLLAFPLLGDRLIREPATYGARQATVTLPNGRIKVADPLSDHDFWFSSRERGK